MKDIAAQLRRRVEPEYVKQRAKEAAVEKSMELKDRIIDSPIALGVIGGLATAAIARVMLNERDRRMTVRQQLAYERDERRLGEKAQEVKARVGEKVEAVKERAAELKDEAMERVESLRERIPSADEVKDKAQQLGTRAREYASEEPLITALGALAIGAAFGFLLPLSEPERRLLAPARERGGTKLESLSNEVTDKVQAKVDDLHDKIVNEGRDNKPSGDLKFPT